MIDLTVLGKVEVRGAEGTDARSLARSPKRLALLAFLAVEGVGTFQRRDVLLSLLWPERSQSRARSALRSLLRLLRQDLGEGVVVNRGQEEVGLAADRIRCDVGRFRDALGEGRSRAALEAYGGDLLPGFFLAASPEFERWLESQRGSLRSRAVETAWALADDAEARGNGMEAAWMARRAVTLSPFDEAASVRLVELLARLGDRTGALAECRRLERQLREEFDLPLPEQIVVLADGLEAAPGPAGGPGGPPSPEPRSGAGTAIAPGPGAGAEISAGPDSDAAGPWARPRAPAAALPVAAVVAVVALGGFTAVRLGWGTSGDDVSAVGVDVSAVAILPFRVEGDPSHVYLGEGVVDLLAMNLDLPGEIRPVDPRTSIALSGDPADSPLTGGRRVAEIVGAGSFISGRVAAAEGELRIVAEWKDVHGRPVADALVEAPEENLGGSVDLLARRLLESRYDEPGAGVRRAAASTSRSLPALRAFLDGEREYRAARYGRASEAFRHALDLDPTFALAHLRRAQAQEWVDEMSAIRASYDSAWAHRDRLPHRVGLLLEAKRAFWANDYDGALSAYGALLSRYPEDVEGLYGMGDLVFHEGPSMGIPMVESRPEFERLLRLDPSNREASLHLARVALAEGRWDEAADLALPLSRGPTIQHAEARAIVMMARGVTPAALDTLRGMSGMEGLNRATIVFRTVEFAGGRTGSLPLVELALDLHNDSDRAAVQVLRAQLHLLRGDGEQATEALAQAARDDPRVGWVGRAALAFARSDGRGPLPRDTVLELLEAAPTDSVEWDDDELATTGRMRSTRSVIFLRGILAAEVGDTAAARALAAELEAGGRLWERSGADLIRAWTALRIGDPAGAAALARKASYLDRNLGLPPFLRAEVHRAVGELTEARRWYASAKQDLSLGLVYQALGEERIAEMGGQ